MDMTLHELTHPVTRNLNSTKALLRATAMAAFAIPFAIGIPTAPRSQAQSPATSPAFEVASIKPHAGGGGSGETGVSSGTMRLDNRPLWHLIKMAYAVMDFQIAGAPEWVKSEGFDIVAKAEGALSGGRMLLLRYGRYWKTGSS
jgi:hypothetical protein